MPRFKRISWLSALGALAALAGAVPAGADIKADCSIDGVVKTYDKDAWPGRVKQGAPLVGGTVKYAFSELDITCVGTSKSLVPEVVDLAATSEGWYDNVVCPMGKAYSGPDGIIVISQSGGTKDYGEAFADEKYKIVFTAAGHGDFYWHDWAKPKSPADPKDVIDEGPADDKEADTKDWQLAGQVFVTANAPDAEKPFPPPPLECPASLTVQGVVHLDPR